MTPLGPFNGKSFATTISPWIVLADALSPFLVPVAPRRVPSAPHFTAEGDKAHYAVTLTADIAAKAQSKTACQSQMDWIYWTVRDMIAHQTCNGCAVRAGDLLATGTISGEARGTNGCLLEITRGGKDEFEMADGTKRVYLQDGDEVALRGWAGELGSEGCVGFGECVGTLRGAESR
jgi:fumarylacetoacetase